MIFVPLNINNQHWQLLVIINVYDSTKDTVIFILDSLQNNFGKTRSHFHMNCYIREYTEELQVEYAQRFTVALVSYLNPNKLIPEIIYKDSVQQVGANCGLHVLLNMEQFICRSDEFLRDPLNRHLNVNMRRWYDKEEGTKLRFIIINLLNEITGVETTETI